ncbi:MAG TPA: RnfABCDGE type electron transport complex subunit D [bacterium]|nr:RnfABCDGE type electron transport complex subunit D [bacterium]
MTPGNDRPLIQWTPPMRRVLWALLPAMLCAVYFFGWRAVMMLAVVNLTAFLSEYLFARHYNEPVHSSVFVTGTLLALSLPPTLPFWMAAVGCAFAVVFGKMVFGGFGRNVFNPAMVGRAFIYITFAGWMTGRWAEPAALPWGGLALWSTDAVTAATMLSAMPAIDPDFWLRSLIGYEAGSLGETSAIALIIGGGWLYGKKVANRAIVNWTLFGMIGLQALLWWAGVPRAHDPLTALLAGGFVLGLFFMTTDPVSAPKNPTAQKVYGLFIGMLTVLIRTFSVWPEGMMFAILLANMFGPITDIAFETLKKRQTGKGT